MMDFFEDEPEINEHGKPYRKHSLWWEIEYWGCMIGISIGLSYAIYKIITNL